jgi:predicted GIY-YIG superfamily endonuclease
MFSVYILYSETKSKYYVGQTNDLQNRLDRHNSAQGTSTKIWNTMESCVHYPSFNANRSYVIRN